LLRNRRAGGALNAIVKKAPESPRFATVTDQQRRLGPIFVNVT